MIGQEEEKLSACRDEEGRVLIFRKLATIPVTPWIQRLLEIAAAIEAVSVQEAIDNNAPADEDMVNGVATDFLPVSFWPLVDEEGATDTQIACLAFDSGFVSRVDTPWCDVDDVKELPASPDGAREALKEWLASYPEPDDHLYVTALEHALARRFGEMGVTTRKILKILGRLDETP
jgi:hypothetical protein